MKIIILISLAAIIYISYIWGEDAGYKRGRKEMLEEIKNSHGNINVYNMLRKASFNASSKQAPPLRKNNVKNVR